MSVTKEQIVSILQGITAATTGKSVADGEILQEVNVAEDGTVRLTIKLEGIGPQDRAKLEDEIYEPVSKLAGVKDVIVKFRAEKVAVAGEKKRLPIYKEGGSGGGHGHDHGHSHGGAVPVSARANAASQAGTPIPGVKNIIAVASGKGGVGKSTVSANLALALAKRGESVGLLDIDIYGPSLHVMMGVTERPVATPAGKISPVVAHGLKLMSLGFISSDDTPMIWRGPMVMGVVSQFLHEVDWAPLDYLIIDLPPGTGDAQLTLVQKVPVTAAIIVTTPSDIALVDARKGLQMFRKTDVPVLGILENMSYFLAPDTGKRYEIFGHGGGKTAADELGTPFLGEVPIDLQIRAGGDAGKPIVLSDPNGAASKPFLELAERVCSTLGKKEGEGEKKKSFLGRIFGRS